MENQSPKSLSFPDAWKPMFLLHVIGSDEILITEKERDSILKAMSQGEKFLQVRQYTIMVNSIQMIRPRYAPDNVPPRPKVKISEAIETLPDGTYGKKLYRTNGELADLWDKHFGKSLAKTHEQI